MLGLKYSAMMQDSQPPSKDAQETQQPPVQREAEKRVGGQEVPGTHIPPKEQPVEGRSAAGPTPVVAVRLSPSLHPA